MRERIAAHPWPRGGVEVIRANRGYTLYSQRTGGQVARLRPTVRMMTSGSCGGVARAGPRRATSDPSSCRSTRRSTSSPPRASSGSALNLQSATKRANSSLEGIAEIPLGALAFLGMLTAPVTGTWTAIEALVGDLWETALNCHPKTLA